MILKKNSSIYLVLLSILLVALSNKKLIAQTQILDITNPSITRSYKIAGLIIQGNSVISEQNIINTSNLKIDQEIKIPGAEISKALKNLWKTNLFSTINIYYTKIIDNKIFLLLKVKERKRVSKFKFTGIKKGDQTDLRKKLSLVRSKILTEELVKRTKKITQTFFVEKGFYNAKVSVIKRKDPSLKNGIILEIKIKKANRMKISKINFKGDSNIELAKLKKFMKNTKEKKIYRFFKRSKFIPEEYEDDKNIIIENFFSRGYRDAEIVSDSIYQDKSKNLVININIHEGDKYYFRNINFIGNTVYKTETLENILNIDKGDIYSKQALESKLYMNRRGIDITSLYMDNGYLFFNVKPVEISVKNDSVDIEIRITEGSQARINNIELIGNTKTKDKVILREIRTLPGKLFSRSDVIRTQQQLAQLGYFNAEKLGIVPKPNVEEGTVDIEYTVEEVSSDQLELSAGYNGFSLVGKAGFSFKNFSLKNLFNLKEWTPIPSGDGQTLSLNIQSNGITFQNYSLSFVEPWLGGKKPVSLSVSLFHSIYNSSFLNNSTTKRTLTTSAISVGIGKRLKFPDDYFILNNELIYQYYDLNNYITTFLTNGYSHSFSVRTTLSRRSVSSPIYPRNGSNLSLSLKFTPPYSFFKNIKDYSGIEPQEKYKFNEFYKWTFKGSWFTEIAKNLVVNTRFGFGILGSYNKTLNTPFGRYYMGGDGLSGTGNLDGREIIALRGYRNNELSPNIGGVAAAKYVVELRYPISLNPSATLYALTFFDAGNTWNSIEKINLFNVYKSVGFGFRIFLPFIGKLGIDFGYRLDDSPTSDKNKKYQIHFSLAGSISKW